MKKTIFIAIIVSLIAISFLPKFLSFERTPFQKNWIVYKQQFIESGRVLDGENNNISSSEGQGFALLFAVFSNDRDQFQEMWAWTQKNMQREDHLFRQQYTATEKGLCDNQCISAQRNASNGDIIIAWALLAAENKWDRQIYLVEGLRVLDVIKTKLIRQKFGYQLILPSETGFELPDDSIQLNLSYWVFPAFNLFAEVTGDPIWAEVYKSGTSLLETARFGDWNLPADWMILSDDKVTLEGANSTEYGENANRLPLYLMLAQDYQAQLMTPFMNFWAKIPLPASMNLLTGQASLQTANSGMQAIKTFTEARMNNTEAKPLPEVTAEAGHDSATLILLSQLPIVKK
ncbi:glycosyl hydrolase family 8 [uncultured Psychromonas sp.]|uniref:glycosyl hydrolase family 8 n=1 Tax=uncultured Psychromonas sp. TaxID=173974 RepID=UPI0026197574|nr:glycosyl hydrolase family 8 [uncultured Psychromonas sp.]